MKDWLIALAGILLLLLVFVGIPVAYIAAPCDKIDWIATKNLPGRCLPGGRG